MAKSCAAYEVKVIASYITTILSRMQDSTTIEVSNKLYSYLGDVYYPADQFAQNITWLFYTAWEYAPETQTYNYLSSFEPYTSKTMLYWVTIGGWTVFWLSDVKAVNSYTPLVVNTDLVSKALNIRPWGQRTLAQQGAEFYLAQLKYVAQLSRLPWNYLIVVRPPNSATFGSPTISGAYYKRFAIFDGAYQPPDYSMCCLSWNVDILIY